MGEVWLAEPLSGGARVVIKCLPSSGLAPEEAKDFRNRLRREAKILMDLRHEGIVASNEWFEDTNEVYLVLEYIEGPTLDEWFKATPQPPLADKLKRVREIAAAVEYAHERGVIHRDLKPSNVLLAGGCVSKVLDFGLARAIDSTKLTQTGLVLGTLAYMAPEQAKVSVVDHRADIYSIGMILAQALGLEGPFRETSATAIYRNLVSDWPIELDEWLPAEIGSPLSKLLEKDPDLRMSSAAEVGTLLDELLANGEELEKKLAAARRAPASSRPTPPRLPRLERPELNTALDELVSRTASKRGGALIVLSLPGGGKSWALDSMAERLRAAQIQVERGSFIEGGLPRLLPWDYLQRNMPESNEDRTVEIPGASGNADELIEGFLTALAPASRTEPVTLLLDDLQFAAAEDFDWISRAMAISQQRPLLLVLAGDVSPEGAGEIRRNAYAGFLAKTAGQNDCSRFNLGAFPLDLLVESLELRSVPSQTAKKIGEVSGGNPALVNLLLARWHAGGNLEGLLQDGPDIYVRRLRARWSLVDPAGHDTIRALVAAGGAADIAQLSAASKLPKLALQARLRELEKKHGWVQLRGNEVHLTQPFFGALGLDQDPAAPPSLEKPDNS